MASSSQDIRMPSTSSQRYDEQSSGIQRRPVYTRNQPSILSLLPGGAPTIASGISQTVPLIAHGLHTRDTTYSTVVAQPTDEEYRRAYTYPNETLQPHFTRKHVTLIAISGSIGTGLFLGSGGALVDGGPLGILLGYLFMSSVIYGLVVSSAEMVSVYPYCRGTVALADRFVDPALGFAMGWNAWFHWGFVIPSQIAAATSLIKYWEPSPRLALALPGVFVFLTTGSVFGARVYGELESVFALIKLFVVVFLVVVAIVLESKDGGDPFRFWNPPFAEYLGIPGPKGKFLGFFAVFVQAAISFFGTEIPSIIAGELKDAPRVIYPVAKRLWMRLSIIYLVAIFVASTLVPRDVLRAQMDPNSPENDAAWASSPFLTALRRPEWKYNWVADLCIACFITSAASAASTEVFLSARYLYFLAKAGHAPKFFGAVWPNTEEAKQKGAIVPWIGVLTTVAFATMSWLCVRPGTNTKSEMEKTFLQVESITTTACLQAWVGTMFTYIRFWRGTCHPKNRRDYSQEIERIKENRAWGQPFWAIYSFTVCTAILLFNGWSLFNPENAVWTIYYDDEDKEPSFLKSQSLKFITTYAPIPSFILVLFGYKLICQTTMRRAMDMNFSGVAYVEGSTPVEVKPESLWGRVWWTLVK